ncbi:MAG: hypothetical protein H6754_02115 [Candidatus Omnitrophica bacterium]|nr:hypothetical protein [Candidatus Omnitrophota bacterium]
MVDAFFMLIKIIFAVLLSPICYAISKSFAAELPRLGGMEHLFIWGVVVYVALQLFFYTPQGLFQFAQKVFGDIFKSVPILAAVVPLFVPIIPTIILVACYVMIAFFNLQPVQSYMLFFAGFTFAMHLILSAHAEFEEDNSGLKPHYLFLFSLTFIFNILLLSVLLALNFAEFSFWNFFSSAFDTAKEIYIHVFNQLFVVK